MKALLANLMIFAAISVWAGESPATVPPTASTVTGEVLEVKDVESYSYLRLKTKDGETWAAVGKAPVKKGVKVTIENVTVMNDFESKSLKKTFPTILFGTLAGAADSMASAHRDVVKGTDTSDIHVEKANGPSARTVVDIVTKSVELKDKTVIVRGKIVKYNSGIMGKNWIHLRDGSGSATENTNDILVTTTNQAKTGDIVTIKGIVHTEKDFGSGYSYKVLIEEATLQK